MILIVFDECNTDAKVRPFCFSERRLTERTRYKFVKSDTDEAGVDFLTKTLNDDFVLKKVSLRVITRFLPKRDEPLTCRAQTWKDVGCECC